MSSTQVDRQLLRPLPSDLVFLSNIPLDILYEFILHSSSSLSTLAAWLSVSRVLLSFAGPLLHKTVALKRSQDVRPFLRRLKLARSSSSPPPSSFFLLLPFVKNVQRLEILALPPRTDVQAALHESPLDASNSIVLAINWRLDAEWEMKRFWIPSLLILFQPQKYEELNKKDCIYLCGQLLATFLDLVNRYTKQGDDVRDAFYQMFTNLASVQIKYETSLASLEPRNTSNATSSLLLLSLVLRFEDERASFREHSLLLETRPTVPMSYGDIEARGEFQKLKFKECTKTFEEIQIEQARLGSA